MINLLIRIGDPTEANFDAAGVARALEIWEEAQEYFAAGRSPPFILDRAPDCWYEISVDASAMLDFLHANHLNAVEAEGYQREQLPSEPSIRLLITPRGAAQSEQPPLRAVGRFLQQLFLAMNIARPGTCTLSASEYPGITDRRPRPPVLSSDVLDDAFCDSQEGAWPVFRDIPFRQTWDWLHEDLAYDIDIAETPSQKALFGLLRICTRDQWDPDNIPMLAQAFESVLGASKGESNGTLVRERLEQVIGAPTTSKKWFNTFYNLRSRIVHGDAPVIRPGGFHGLADPRVKQIRDEAGELEWRAVAALLALLQDMVMTNTRAYQFEQRLIRDES